MRMYISFVGDFDVTVMSFNKGSKTAAISNRVNTLNLVGESYEFYKFGEEILIEHRRFADDWGIEYPNLYYIGKLVEYNIDPAVWVGEPQQ